MKKKLFLEEKKCFSEKNSIFWAKNRNFVNVWTSLQGKHKGLSIMLGLGTKWAKNANIWPKMTQKGQNLPILGQKTYFVCHRGG